MNAVILDKGVLHRPIKGISALNYSFIFGQLAASPQYISLKRRYCLRSFKRDQFSD